MATVDEPTLPTDKFILDGVDVSAEPHFTVAEVAKVFFGKSSHWVRLQEKNGKLLLDGEPVGNKRTNSGARRYDLADIEKVAHALASSGAIKPAELTMALVIVQTVARVWHYI